MTTAHYEIRFNHDDNMTFVHNDNRSHGQCAAPVDDAMHLLVFYVILTVGIPSNLLSAVIWLRHSVACQSSSAVYLAAVAINDLAYLFSTFAYISKLIDDTKLSWLDESARYVAMSAATLEPLLVLAFSVERLIAIIRPLQVCLSSSH